MKCKYHINIKNEILTHNKEKTAQNVVLRKSAHEMFSKGYSEEGFVLTAGPKYPGESCWGFQEESKKSSLMEPSFLMSRVPESPHSLPSLGGSSSAKQFLRKMQKQSNGGKRVLSTKLLECLYIHRQENEPELQFHTSHLIKIISTKITDLHIKGKTIALLQESRVENSQDLECVAKLLELTSKQNS